MQDYTTGKFHPQHGWLISKYALENPSPCPIYYLCTLVLPTIHQDHVQLRQEAVIEISRKDLTTVHPGRNANRHIATTVY